MNPNFKFGVLLLYTRLSVSYMATKALRKLTYVPAFIVSLKYYQQHQNNAKQYCFPLNSSYVSKGIYKVALSVVIRICYNKKTPNININRLHRYAKDTFTLYLINNYKNKILLQTVTCIFVSDTHAYTIDYIGCQCILMFKVPKTLLTFRQHKSRGGWLFRGGVWVLFWSYQSTLVSNLASNQQNLLDQVLLKSILMPNTHIYHAIVSFTTHSTEELKSNCNNG